MSVSLVLGPDFPSCPPTLLRPQMTCSGRWAGASLRLAFLSSSHQGHHWRGPWWGCGGDLQQGPPIPVQASLRPQASGQQAGGFHRAWLRSSAGQTRPDQQSHRCCPSTHGSRPGRYSYPLPTWDLGWCVVEGLNLRGRSWIPELYWAAGPDLKTFLRKDLGRVFRYSSSE